MKILLLTHIFPPAVDGGSRVIFKLGEYLQNQQHQVFCLTSNCFSTDDFVNPKSKIIDKDTTLNINTIRLPVYKRLRRPLKFINLFIFKKSYFHQLLEVFQKGPIFKIIPLIKALIVISKNKPDLIICGPLPTTIVIYASFLNRIFKSKLLINSSFHETDPDFFKKPLIKSLQSATYLWTLTEHESTFFKTQFSIDSKKIILAGNGVDEDILLESQKNIFPKSPNLLFIGSLAAHKKLEVLLKSFIQILPQYPSLTLTIAGQKTLYYPKIESILKQIPKNNVNLCFNFNQSELKNLIDKATILVLPSIQESFGLVLIESWARGKPVITSDISTLKELVDKSSGGVTFKRDDSNNLANQITTLLNDPLLCKKLGQNGLNYVKTNYTWTKVGQKLCTKILS